MARLSGRRYPRRILHARSDQGDDPYSGDQLARAVSDTSGIPAAILTEFLDARRVEIARTGDYTVLVLFAIGTSKGKWGSLLENLFEFKRLYDTEAPLEEALPELVAKHPKRYGPLTLKDLSDEMHAAMIELNLTNLLHDACDVDPDPVLTPADTYQKLLRNGTEKIKFSEAAGRVTGVMLVPYPPGIPVRMPGERLGGPDSPTIKLILALQEFGKRFPGIRARSAWHRERCPWRLLGEGDHRCATGERWRRSSAAVRANGHREKPPTSAPPVKKRRVRPAKSATASSGTK